MTNDLTYARRFLWGVLAIIAGLLATALYVATLGAPPSTPIFGALLPRDDASMTMWVGPPKDLRDMVERADIVVIGTIAGDGQRVTHGAFTEEGTLELRPEDDESALRGFRHEILIERVLKQDGSVSEGGTIILRGSDMDVYRDGPFVNPVPGERVLIAARRLPDGSYLETHGGYSRFTLDGPVVRFNDRGKSPVEIPGMTNVPPEAFIGLVQAALARPER